jgi:hypothetical protein
MEVTMLKMVLVAAGVLAATVVTAALPTPAAMAEAPKCKTKANKYVACTDRLRAKAPRKKAGYLKFESVRKGD